MLPCASPRARVSLFFASCKVYPCVQRTMIHWLIQTVVDHPDLSALRPPPGLLTRTEAAHYATLHNPQRRRDWLLGRWTAKHLGQQAVRATQGYTPALDSFHISYDALGAPYIQMRDTRLPVAISHSHGYAFCALAADTTRPTRIGVDIELVEPRPADFAQTFLTATEQARLTAALPEERDRLTTALWSAKEAIFKARGHGLTVDPRQVECTLYPARPRHWTRLRADLNPTLRAAMPCPLRVWWRVIDNRLRPDTHFVLTIAAYGLAL